MAFSPTERATLLSLPHIGPVVLTRLERAGFDSFDALRRAGSDTIVSAVCDQIGSGAWANRRRAIQRALAHLEA